MRYHNITKDDMLNGEGLRTVLGWQAAAIIVLSAIILLHGILMADWFLM